MIIDEYFVYKIFTALIFIATLVPFFLLHGLPTITFDKETPGKPKPRIVALNSLGLQKCIELGGEPQTPCGERGAVDCVLPVTTSE